MKSYIIFGAPFVGKSTMLARVSTLVAERRIPRIKVLDLEWWGMDWLKGKAAFVQDDTPRLLGAGATNIMAPELCGITKLVLDVPDYLYVFRRKSRQSMTLGHIPDKYHQLDKAMEIYSFFNSKAFELGLKKGTEEELISFIIQDAFGWNKSETDTLRRTNVGGHARLYTTEYYRFAESYDWYQFGDIYTSHIEAVGHMKGETGRIRVFVEVTVGNYVLENVWYFNKGLIQEERNEKE